MVTRGRLLLIAVCVVASVGSLLSHHAVGEVYDERETMTLEGEIVALVYRNPHSILHLEVADRRGAPHTWAVEWRAATRLRQTGVALSTLQPGDRVIVCGNPGRDPGRYRLRLLALRRPLDGWAAHGFTPSNVGGGPIRRSACREAG